MSYRIRKLENRGRNANTARSPATPVVLVITHKFRRQLDCRLRLRQCNCEPDGGDLGVITDSRWIDLS